MTKNEYNGWTNYETWNVKLWIDNEQSSQEYWAECARDTYERAVADKTFSKEENAALQLMAQIKDEHEDFAQDVLEKSEVQASWVADLMNAALSEVNWHEIAKHLIDAAKEDLERV